MKSEIIKDLLPIYCDGVCSEETSAEIESHIADCPDCQSLLEVCRSDIKSVNTGAPEKPFRRIKEKIFRNKLAAAALMLVLVCVLSAVGYLTYGQITRSPDHPSFETIISTHNAKKLMKRFCDGDIDYVMENIEIYQTSNALLSDRENVREHCRSALSDFYERYLKGRKLSVKTGGYSGYDTFQYESGTCPMTELQLYDERSGILSFCVIEHTGGKFLLSNTGYSLELGDDCESDIAALDLALNPIEPMPYLETRLLNIDEVDSQSYRIFARRFSSSPEELQEVMANTAALMEDMYCENAFYTDFRFDAEGSRYLVDMGFIFKENSSGRQVVYSRTVRLRSAKYSFEILPEFEPVIVDNGISPENLEKLKKLFTR